jgi:hypothetical protein
MPKGFCQSAGQIMQNLVLSNNAIIEGKSQQISQKLQKKNP